MSSWGKTSLFLPITRASRWSSPKFRYNIKLSRFKEISFGQDDPKAVKKGKKSMLISKFRKFQADTRLRQVKNLNVSRVGNNAVTISCESIGRQMDWSFGDCFLIDESSSNPLKWMKGWVLISSPVKSKKMKLSFSKQLKNARQRSKFMSGCLRVLWLLINWSRILCLSWLYLPIKLSSSFSSISLRALSLSSFERT